MPDDHTGVSDVQGIPYTYEHVEELPTADSEYYRITGVLELVGRPIHKNVYYVPAGRLDEFITNHTPEVGEEIVDVQPVSDAERNAALAEYQGAEN